MPTLDLLLEAEKRGILPDDKKALLTEARSRGLVPSMDQEGTSTTTTATTQGMVPMKNVKPGLLENISGKDFAKQAALPVAGALLAPLLGPAELAIPLIAAGGFGGEAINQATGITPRSNEALGIQLAAPLIPGMGAAGVKRLPGATGALHELAIEEASKLPGKYAGRQSIDTLFNQAKQLGGQMPLQDLSIAADALLQKEKPMAGRIPQAIEYLSRLTDRIHYPQPGDVPISDPAEFHREMSRVGKLGRDAEAAGNTALAGEYKKIYSTFHNTLDSVAKDLQSSANPAAVKLLDAISASRQKLASEDLAWHINKGISTVGGYGDLRKFNARAVIDSIDKDELLKKTFDKGAMKEVKDILYKLNKIPANPVAPGVQAGSMRTIFRGALGSAVGHATGIPQEYAIAGTLAANEVIGRTLMTPAGRQLLKGIILRSPDNISEKSFALLAAFVNSQGKEGGPNQPQINSPIDFNKLFNREGTP